MSANPGSDREDYFWIVDYAMQDEQEQAVLPAQRGQGNPLCDWREEENGASSC